MRRVPGGSSWHPATDQLAGTEQYGQQGGAAAWSTAWSGQKFTELLVGTADLQHWLVVAKTDLLAWYSGTPVTIQYSSINCNKVIQHNTQTFWSVATSQHTDP